LFTKRGRCKLPDKEEQIPVLALMPNVNTEELLRLFLSDPVMIVLKDEWLGWKSA
jgi:hypothetical protein